MTKIDEGSTSKGSNASSIRAALIGHSNEKKLKAVNQALTSVVQQLVQ